MVAVAPWVALQVFLMLLLGGVERGCVGDGGGHVVVLVVYALAHWGAENLLKIIPHFRRDFFLGSRDDSC